MWFLGQCHFYNMHCCGAFEHAKGVRHHTGRTWGMDVHVTLSNYSQVPNCCMFSRRVTKGPLPGALVVGSTFWFPNYSRPWCGKLHEKKRISRGWWSHHGWKVLFETEKYRANADCTHGGGAFGCLWLLVAIRQYSMPLGACMYFVPDAEAAGHLS